MNTFVPEDLFFFSKYHLSVLLEEVTFYHQGTNVLSPSLLQVNYIQQPEWLPPCTLPVLLEDDFEEWMNYEDNASKTMH